MITYLITTCFLTIYCNPYSLHSLNSINNLIVIEEASFPVIPYQDCRHVRMIFSRFTKNLFEVFKQTRFEQLRRACIQNVGIPQGGLRVSSKIKRKIMNTEDYDRLSDLLCMNSQYCNWMNIKMLENMAASSPPEAIRLINEYQAEVFSRPLTEVIEHIPEHKIKEKHHKKIRLKYKKDFNSLLVKDIVEIWDKVEEKFNVKRYLLIKKIAKGCVEICWLIHNDLVKHAIHAIHAICTAVSNPSVVYNDQQSTEQLFSDTLCLEIGSFIVKSEKTPSGEL